VTDPLRERLSLDLEVPKRFPLGEPVPITLILRNTSDRHVDLNVPGRPVAFDIVITSADGSVVWRRMKGRIIAAILQVLELAPYSSLELRDDWMQRTDAGVLIEPGEYSVVGELPVERQSPLITPSRRIEIVDAS
jgi:intracellular proteinase inhibitor BsuPI